MAADSKSRLPGSLRSPAAHGALTCLAALTAVAIWEFVNGDSAGLLPLLLDGARPRTTLVVILLLGFFQGAPRHAGNGFRRDLDLLIPTLRSSPERREQILEQYDVKPGRGSRIASTLGSDRGCADRSGYCCLGAVAGVWPGTRPSLDRGHIPQFLAPHLLDQYWWGKRIMSMGLAPEPLPRARLTTDRLAESIESVLGNEFLSDRAREVGEQIAPAPTPRVAADQILSSLLV